MISFDSLKDGSYECHCAKVCKKPFLVRLNKTKTTTLTKTKFTPLEQRTQSQATNQSTNQSIAYRNITPNKFSTEDLRILDDYRFDLRLVPIAKQGGSACYPSACMNGGTCFTNNNPTYYYTATYVSPQTTTTPAPPPNYNPPLCVNKF
jgi:hypothetical protein